MEFEYTAQLATAEELNELLKNSEHRISTKRIGKPYHKLCETCGQLCTSTLYRHMKSHTATVEKFQCTWCKRLYASKQSLQRHARKSYHYQDKRKSSSHRQHTHHFKYNMDITPKFSVAPGTKTGQ